MRLEVGSFHINSIEYGVRTGWMAGPWSSMGKRYGGWCWGFALRGRAGAPGAARRDDQDHQRQGRGGAALESGWAGRGVPRFCLCADHGG